MKKRNLQEQAKYAENKILDENADFYSEMQGRYNTPKPTNRVVLLRIGGVAAVAVILIVCLAVLLTNIGNNNDEPYYYISENEIPTDSDVSEVQQYFSNVEFNIDSNKYIFKMMRTYDKINEDTLFFSTNLTGEEYFESIFMYFYTNPRYGNIKTLSGDIKTREINGISIDYTERITEDDDGIFEFEYFASIKSEDKVIYIEYNQMWYENSTNFFNFLEQTVKSK